MNQIQNSDAYAPLTEITAPWRPARRALAQPFASFVRKSGLLLFMVALPTLVAVFYFGFWATPIYTSEASYVVRKPNENSWSVFSKILQTAGLARAQDDAFVINQFITSRDAVALLDGKFDLRGHYGGAAIDPVSAFPGIFHSLSNERLYRYFQKHIDVYFDPATGVTEFEVRSFDPVYSQQLNHELLNAAEDLVNRINQRWRDDAIRYAMAEVKEREAALEQAHDRITSFRTQSLFVDPKQLSEELGKTVTNLAWNLAQARARLQSLEPEQSDSPQAAAVRRTIGALEQQILEERRKIAGDDASIATAIMQYEKLFLDQEFAERALLAAMQSLENAKQHALRQQLYLERITAPSVADYPSHPKRILRILTVFVLSLCVFVVVRFLLQEVRAHGTF